jgi:hypothetical protein
LARRHKLTFGEVLPFTKRKTIGEQLHLPGRLQGLGVAQNRNAGPVKYHSLFAGIENISHAGRS